MKTRIGLGWGVLGLAGLWVASAHAQTQNSQPPSAPASKITLYVQFKSEGGRPHSGAFALRKALDILATEYPGEVERMEQDGPAAVFEQNFTYQVSSSFLDQFKSEVQKFPGASVESWQSIAQAIREPASPSSNPVEMLSLADDFERRPITQRLKDAWILASQIKSPSATSPIDPKVQEKLAWTFYSLAADLVRMHSAFSAAVEVPLRQEIADRIEASGSQVDWGMVYDLARERMKNPRLPVRSDLNVLQSGIARLAESLKDLSLMNHSNPPETPQLAALYLLQLIPFADGAAAEPIKKDISYQKWLVNHWFDFLQSRVDHSERFFATPELLEAYRKGKSGDMGWSLWQSSGGYQILPGHRVVMDATPAGKVSTERADAYILFLLGWAGEEVRNLIKTRAVQLLLDNEGKIPAMAEANKNAELDRKREEVRAYRAHHGLPPLTQEEEANWMESFGEHFLQDHMKWNYLDGLYTLDRHLQSLVAAHNFLRIDGFSENRFYQGVAEIYEELLKKTRTPSMYRKVLDTALWFTDIARENSGDRLGPVTLRKLQALTGLANQHLIRALRAVPNISAERAVCEKVLSPPPADK